MNIAVVKEGTITNVIVASMEVAQQFIDEGHLDGDTVVELQPGFGIGDTYVDGLFVKAPFTAVAPPVNPDYQVAPGEATLYEQVKALEECMVEMAYIVYA